MAVVELAVENELLPDYETMQPSIGGQETGRRPCPYAEHVTLIALDMAEAPDNSTTMEVVLERVLNKGTRIVSAAYSDSDGNQLAFIQRPDDTGWIQPT
ncbi:hypothetical protein AB0I27_22580 [Streptomyces sp. NPDC050597]|uniref:hypothetical protein n=1 Tax=Streptomyces sp. NPDC050597 TaxID=3157212 RepID=UPI0034281069